MRFLCFEKPLSLFLSRYARLVTRFPTPFVLVPLFTLGFFALGYFRYPFRFREDSTLLYTPDDGRAKTERRVLEKYFSIDENNPSFQQRRFGFRRMGFLIATAAPHSELGSNVLRSEVLAQVAELWREISEEMMIEHGNQSFSYEDLCILVQRENVQKFVSVPTSRCVGNPLIDVLAVQNYTTVYNDTNRLLMDNDMVLDFVGGVVFNDDGIKSAKAILLPYALRYSTPDDDVLALIWERKLTQFLTSFDSPLIEVAWLTSQSLYDEAARDTQQLRTLLGPLLGLITIFTLGCCVVRSRVRSKPWLGLAGIFCAFAAIVSAVSLMRWLEMEFCTVAYFMPFIVFSIGVDNVFILMAAWRKTAVTADVKDRMSAAFRDAGVSITVTTLTDVLSFGVGCSSSIPSVRIFCVSAALAIAFVYIYQLTLFTALMSLAGTAEDNGRHCLTFCKVKRSSGRDSLNSSKLYAAIRYSSSTIYNTASGATCGTVKETALSLFFRDTYTTLLLQPMVKALVILVFIGYIGISIFGCLQIRVGFNPVDLLPVDSYALRSTALKERYFSNNAGYLHVCFIDLQNLDYNSPFWLQLNHELTRFENTSFTGFADSWLRKFLHHVSTTASGSSSAALDANNFSQFLSDWLFANNQSNQVYQSDIVFDDFSNRNKNRSKLVATRFPIRLRKFNFGNHSHAVALLRRLADSSPLNVTLYHEAFDLADQYGTLLPSTLLSIAQAGAAVVGVSLLLIPKPLCALWVSLTIASINVGILGLMTLWSVNLDFVTMTTIIMNIGFCVDFSAHIAYHFSKDTSDDSVKRVRAALQAVGMPIIQSALSTVLGVSVLLYVDNYVFRAFVKTVVLVVILGTFHGLVVLPVLLTLSHCESDRNRKQPVTELSAPFKRIAPPTVYTIDVTHPDQTPSGTLQKPGNWQLARSDSFGCWVPKPTNGMNACNGSSDQYLPGNLHNDGSRLMNAINSAMNNSNGDRTLDLPAVSSALFKNQFGEFSLKNENKKSSRIPTVDTLSANLFPSQPKQQGNSSSQSKCREILTNQNQDRRANSTATASAYNNWHEEISHKTVLPVLQTGFQHPIVEESAGTDIPDLSCQVPSTVPSSIPCTATSSSSTSSTVLSIPQNSTISTAPVMRSTRVGLELVETLRSVGPTLEVHDDGWDQKNVSNESEQTKPSTGLSSTGEDRRQKSVKTGNNVEFRKEILPLSAQRIAVKL